GTRRESGFRASTAPRICGISVRSMRRRMEQDDAGIDALIVRDSAGPLKRIAVLASSTGGFYVANSGITPYVTGRLMPWVSSFDRGRQLFLKLLLVWSFTSAVASTLWIALLVKLRVLRPPPIFTRPASAFVLGAVGGVIMSAITAAIW